MAEACYLGNMATLGAVPGAENSDHFEQCCGYKDAAVSAGFVNMVETAQPWLAQTDCQAAPYVWAFAPVDLLWY